MFPIFQYYAQAVSIKNAVLYASGCGREKSSTAVRKLISRNELRPTFWGQSYLDLV